MLMALRRPMKKWTVATLLRERFPILHAYPPLTGTGYLPAAAAISMAKRTGRINAIAQALLDLLGFRKPPLTRSGPQ
jgi:hypothetical protein